MTKSAATEARLAYLYRRTLIVDGQWYLVTEIYGLARRYPVIAVSEDGVERAFEEHFAVQSVAPGAPTPRTSEECACVPRIVNPAIGGLDREAIYAHYDLETRLQAALPKGWLTAAGPGYYREFDGLATHDWILGECDIQYIDPETGHFVRARNVSMSIATHALERLPADASVQAALAIVRGGAIKGTVSVAGGRGCRHFGRRHLGTWDGRRPSA